MRIFSLASGSGSDYEFTEYQRLPFEVDHEESVLEKWLESNPDAILEGGGIMILGRQVRTNLGGFIDLLGVDRAGNVVVVELKRDRTPRDAVAQALEYAAFAERLDADALERLLRGYEGDESPTLVDCHREYFDLHEAEAVAFNKDQHIVIIGQRISPEIRQTASFLGSKGISVICIEFTFFQAEDGGRVLSQDVVVGKEQTRGDRLESGSLPVISETEFLNTCDENGKELYSRILQWARDKSLSVRWGSRGFSFGVDIGGSRVVVGYAFPLGSSYKQTFYTALRDRAGIQSKTVAPPEEIESLQRDAEATGLFGPAGRELKCRVDRALTVSEIDSLIAWCESVEQAILKHGLKDTAASS